MWALWPHTSHLAQGARYMIYIHPSLHYTYLLYTQSSKRVKIKSRQLQETLLVGLQSLMHPHISCSLLGVVLWGCQAVHRLVCYASYCDLIEFFPLSFFGWPFLAQKTAVLCHGNMVNMFCKLSSFLLLPLSHYILWWLIRKCWIAKVA